MMRSIGIQELLICGCMLFPLLLGAVLVVVLSTRGRGGAPTQAMPTTPAGWYPDPAQRYQVRYWDGAAWTAAVANDGVQSVDPNPL